MNKNDINKILNGGLVVFPTDTVYALACIPDKVAINKIYYLKKRSFSKKIIALISDIELIKEITDEKIDINFVSKYMPGALTIIVKSNDKFKNLVGDTVGFRIPNSDIARNIIRNCGGILMTTSANISGEPSPNSYKDISKKIIDNVDVKCIDHQKLSGIPSTIISIDNGIIKTIREGEIKIGGNYDKGKSN